MVHYGTGGWRRPLFFQAFSRLFLAAPTLPDATERDALRREMRARRRGLALHEQITAARGFARVIAGTRLLRPGRHVAMYLRQGSEANLSMVIALARRLGCVIYLPAITHLRHSRMEFVRFDAATPLRRNRFGILEPDPAGARRTPIRELDLVLLPLVAVDMHGWRLGSGAGFYDRRLHHLRVGRHWRRPKLVGIAYEFQRVPRLGHARWDVPLDAVITEKNLYSPAMHLAANPPSAPQAHA